MQAALAANFKGGRGFQVTVATAAAASLHPATDVCGRSAKISVLFAGTAHEEARMSLGGFFFFRFFCFMMQTANLSVRSAIAGIRIQCAPLIPPPSGPALPMPSPSQRFPTHPGQHRGRIQLPWAWASMPCNCPCWPIFIWCSCLTDTFATFFSWCNSHASAAGTQDCTIQTTPKQLSFGKVLGFVHYTFSSFPKLQDFLGKWTI